MVRRRRLIRKRYSDALINPLKRRWLSWKATQNVRLLCANCACASFPALLQSPWSTESKLPEREPGGYCAAFGMRRRIVFIARLDGLHQAKYTAAVVAIE